MIGPAPTAGNATLMRLFLGRHPARGLTSFVLPGGRTLFQAGDTPKALYLVRSGRLAILRDGEDGRLQLLGVVKPGEPVGEMALVAGAAHSASAVAMRDSEVLALPRELFLREARLRPDLISELAVLMIRRARETARDAIDGAGAPTVFGFVSAAPDAPVRPLIAQIAKIVRRAGRKVAVIGVEALTEPAAWFSRVERDHDFVILAVESGETQWREAAARQLDRMLIVGSASAAPPGMPHRFATPAFGDTQRVDVVLSHPSEGRVSGSQRWVDAVGAERVFHVRAGVEEDTARLARVLTGTSIGLVLSGGGARAYAHVGAIRALRESGHPIDLVGGASMGGIVGAGLARGWDGPELEARIKKAFVASNPVGDMALPMVALSRGERVRHRLREHFGDVTFADLDLPYFCVSSNLTTGLAQVHRSGLVREALRASSALPGVMPPVVRGGEVLVDGGVLDNLPTSTMRALHRGPVIGVDVAENEVLSPEEVERPPSMWRFIASGAWRRRGPPLVALLIRAATVTTHREFAAAREASDVLILPDMPRVGLQDWKLYAPAVEAGYVAARAALEKLERPLTELRRHTLPPTVATREDLVRLDEEAARD